MTVYSVSDFLAHVNDALSRSWNAYELAIEGEVSEFKISQKQWINFSLKDENATVPVFMTVWQLKIPIEDGMKIRVYGMPRVYPKFGKFSLNAERVEAVGEGALKKALAALRAKLEAEGLFDQSRKRELPFLPNRIALVASRESAAYGDFARVLNERWRGLQIDLYHVKVQGEGAAAEVARAIEQANVQADSYDALVLTRGGGSLEELASFNDEMVVRAVFASKIPTLVGIGHERDTCLAEEAADVRASTPTDCARRLVPDRVDLLRDLQYKTASMEKILKDSILERQLTVERALNLPANWIRQQKHQVEILTSAISTNVQQWHKALQDRFRSDIRLLASLDPKGVLARGYAMLRDARGRTLSSVGQINPQMEVAIVLRDGDAKAQIKQIGRAGSIKASRTKFDEREGQESLF